ncbi:hypothetical protein SS322685_1780 [Shigella sonnei 3226-85]|uniref:Uncharacterized protein n=1 Tax=Escherichia coli ISC7 TaxID=1432555 RepID=W1ES98_ECOLX|nr:hypothetical protein ECDEC11D_2188 [Escherichia coli DEC11D]EHX32395.1 hypothetical protein ECDEC12C_2381 [Escherichia coli DEC12C]EIQ44865.1 hypothetical protein SS322685_1780 [Shigella sonnei 3226-85]EIQ46112.1 hypothetical protein SS323385_1300 [Shigella sonnei 3233-85]EIQ53688.1 hypothetical protein SS482266_1287 [Shigella sonnei 4822-66]EJL18629.1 hypothetical protein SSMOSELEY_1551 [Shigella sonnei str. Moseley]CDL25049.1 hypothetical protein [Escherichia coli ISC7]
MRVSDDSSPSASFVDAMIVGESVRKDCACASWVTLMV